MDLHKIKQVKELKEQCKRYGVKYTDVARECDFNVNSFESAMQSGSISRARVNKAFEALRELVYKKGIEYTVRKAGLDPNATKENLANCKE